MQRRETKKEESPFQSPGHLHWAPIFFFPPPPHNSEWNGSGREYERNLHFQFPRPPTCPFQAKLQSVEKRRPPWFVALFPWKGTPPPPKYILPAHFFPPSEGGRERQQRAILWRKSYGRLLRQRATLLQSHLSPGQGERNAALSRRQATFHSGGWEEEEDCRSPRKSHISSSLPSFFDTLLLRSVP